MQRRFTLVSFSASTLVLLSAAASADVGVPHGASIVRILGARAETTLAPGSGQIGALVRIPQGVLAKDLGVEAVAPGIGRVRGRSAIAAFASAHPNVFLEVAPPLKTLLDKAGAWINARTPQVTSLVDGTGVLVGVADTGLDVTHPDFIDENGKTRVAWLLDLSIPPVGKYPDIEQKFGIKDANGKVTAGAVFSGEDIDILRASGAKLPRDEVGHGTHVASIACGNGGVAPNPHTPFVGVAPKAKLVFARVTGPSGESIDNDDLVRGVQFIFDRADTMKLPISVNLSLGSDFGSHDGLMLWEQSLASFVGPDHPGHALVAAAGNSGSVVEGAIHQSVHVNEGTRMRVPIVTDGADSGGIQVWVGMRSGSELAVGLEAPDVEWIAPIGAGGERGRNQDQVNAGVINGDSVSQSPVPQGSHSAVVIWSGKWPAGTYNITLEGHGLAELYMQAVGDASVPGFRSAQFASGVREGTINLPATSPGIIGVGCTVNRPGWKSINDGDVGLRVPILDSIGGLGDPSHRLRSLIDGEVCWFSSAGPTVTGVMKPEIAAPGGVVVAAMSSQALPGSDSSIFTNPGCPATSKSGGSSDPKCLQIDATHAVAVGTSMSAPLVAGAVALLLQRDPTLTQDKIVALLQAGAHHFRGPSPFQDQAGPGELDVQGALDALDQMRNPALQLPSLQTSWLTLSSDYFAADGSSPMTAIFELRTADGQHRADMFEPSSFVPYVLVNGVARATPAVVKHAPGVWYSSIQLESGLGGSTLTIGATFNGVDVVAPRTIPIGTDIWTAEYPSKVKGGCAVSPRGDSSGGALAGLAALAALAFTSRWGRRWISRQGSGESRAARRRRCPAAGARRRA